MPNNNQRRHVMTAEDIERLQAGAIKLSPSQVGRAKSQGTPSRYSIGYHPSRKLIRGTNGSFA